LTNRNVIDIVTVRNVTNMVSVHKRIGGHIMSILNITKENFQSEVTESKKPVLVDFWAPWCGYCRRISPALDQLGEENGGAVQIGKINIDEQMELAEKFQVMTIPTMILFKDGQVGKPLVAAQSKGQIEQWLKEQGM
jgi:thioredoxin 1